MGPERSLDGPEKSFDFKRMKNDICSKIVVAIQDYIVTQVFISRKRVSLVIGEG